MAREDKASLDCGHSNWCQLHNTITASTQQERSREEATKKSLKIKRVLSPTLDNFKKPPVYTGQDVDQYYSSKSIY